MARNSSCGGVTDCKGYTGLNSTHIKHIATNNKTVTNRYGGTNCYGEDER